MTVISHTIPTIGSLVSQLYKNPDDPEGEIQPGQASDYHDELGHIVAAWFYGLGYTLKTGKNIATSTERVLPEQINELSQRMMMRCSLQAPKFKDNQHNHEPARAGLPMLSTGAKKQVAGSAEKNKNLTIMRPDPKGRKLTKNETLAWTVLYCLEDLHILAEHVLCRRQTEMMLNSLSLPDGISRFTISDPWSQTTKANLDFENPYALYSFKQSVAAVMDYLMVEPDAVHETRPYREYLCENAVTLMGLYEGDYELENRIMRLLNDDKLSDFYDTFKPCLDALDAVTIPTYYKALSQHTVEELRRLPVTITLQAPKPPIYVTDQTELTADSCLWKAIAIYEQSRELLLIDDFIPPRLHTEIAHN
ncbi:MAG: hypothetical protein F6K58_17195 [Symploca sp. SIO2E9]|nr:hypothetical protein [Symploca sp. SIO2E9]